jgi:aryl-alcohol dehydrogenase-like predicted oxidoreductase
VPFDEGSLTGMLTPSTRWPEGDWRNLYFPPAHLAEALEHVDRLRPLVPPGMTLPELALRFILHHPAVTTVIPGMRKLAHVRANCGVSDGRPLATDLIAQLRAHRWERDWVVA